MIRFQCPFCRGIVASDVWEPGGVTICAYCTKEVAMPLDRLLPGCVIGDFLLVNELGVGGMGVVYKAHQLSLDRPAAIKILKPEISQDREAVQAFVGEARSAAKLNHPNIVQAYAVGEDSGIFYFAMEYIDGKTMKEILQEKGKIPPREAASVIMQTAQALDCAWKEQKLIHHDIKPDNILVCNDNRVKLADLGLAQVFGEDADDDSNEVAGTPQYISPEQLTGVITDTRSDIYSLGATFYHLVTGRFAYVAENTDEIAKQHVYGTLTPPKEVEPDLPDEINNIIVKMMEKAPEKRFQDCSELIQAIKSYLDSPGTPSVKMDSLNTPGSNQPGISAIQPKLGISNGGSIPKISVPASPVKISIKNAVKQAETSAEAVAAPEKQEKAAPAPAVPLKITLNTAKKSDGAKVEPVKVASGLNDTALPQTPEVADAAPESAEAVAPAPEKMEAPANVETDAKAENADGETLDAASENIADTEENATPEKNRKRKGVKVFWITLIVLLLVAAVAGGGWFYYEYFIKNAGNGLKTPEPAQKPVKVVPAAETEVVQNVPAEPAFPEVKVELAKQVVPVKQVLSPFMTKVKQLEEISFSNEQSFMNAWRSSYRSLKPANAQEKNVFKELENKYVEIDERTNVEVNRKRLLDAYNKQVANLQQREILRDHKNRIMEAEKAAFARAESSAANYKKDLSRKMGILDYAMITAARTRRPADWDNFLKAVELAMAEPARVADRPDFVPTAKELAVYAEQLKLAAEQGREFTENLRRNAFAKKQLEGNGVLVRVISSNAVTLNLSVQYENAAKPFIPKKVKYNKAKKGKAAVKPKPKPKAKPKAPAGKRYGRAKTERLNLLTMPLDDVNRWVSFIEQSWGKGDQYFYYMLYNGNMRSRLSEIAPDEYWEKHVDRIPRRYFRRAIFMATPPQLEALKKSYGEWLSFKNALKEFETQKKE